ncbi:MAG TPA: ubiquinol-cytochrome c reductase iron-sulfur subunit [Acidiferrobacteraceae bacterium]|nr:ubiquinol-cytochrome c reductase iron-sulfur subunit [Acidiferrobacteraceae bacterium]HEX19910.1 ubiquinol-cytochrome c reductase iron-sulfur subunit [Acidiferrobacteraceae bacterium]
MKNEDDIKRERRRLIVATTVLGGIGAVACSVPFIASMFPSARARSEGAPVEVDISKLEEGQFLVVLWQKKPIWIFKRTKAMLANLEEIADILVDPESDVKTQQPDYTKSHYRSIKPEIFVVIPFCTHLGCIPTKKLLTGAQQGMDMNWPGGFYCPCHGSKFDLAGRVFKSVPAPTNLLIPPHAYINDSRIVIGPDQI